jgi:hypothetical protein
MSPETHDPELASLAAGLAKLAPSAGRLDRDQLLFRAGRASAGQRGWLWPGVAAFLALTLGAIGLAEWLGPAPQRVERVVYRRIEPPASPAEQIADRQPATPYAAPNTSDQAEAPLTEQSYARMQRLVFAFGVDALPNPPAAAALGDHGSLVHALPRTLSRNDWLRMQSP